jgi:hypothetical protein
MKQTAVEWLIQELKENSLLTFDEWKDIVQQAKEMEKEQRRQDFRAGWHGNKHKDWNCEFYLEKYISNDFKSE